MNLRAASSMGLLLLLSASIASAGLTDGLVAYYPFDGDAQDASGHGYHGTVNGCTVTQDHRGVNGSAYEFDGVDDYIYYGPILPDMDTMTISVWLYSDEQTGGDATQDSVLFADGDSDLGKDVNLTTNSDNKIVLRADKNGFPFYWTVTSSKPLHQTWRHLVWVMTGAVSYVYLDGQKISTIQAGGSNRGNHNFVLGTEEFPPGRFGALHGFWKGKISALRIYDRELSDSEVQDLYTLESTSSPGGSPGTGGPGTGGDTGDDDDDDDDDADIHLADGLIADYPLNGDANDVSGNSRHGVVHGATPTSDQNAQENGAYQFDGVDDYISFGSVLPDMDDMTVSMWVQSEAGGSGTAVFVDSDWTPRNDVMFGIDSTNHVVLVANKNGSPLDDLVSVTTPLTGRWRHIVWILSGVYTSVYIDGGEAASIEKGGANKGFHSLLLGTQEYPRGHFGYQGYWKGKMSSLRIYNRILSDSEIRALYRAGTSPASTPGGAEGYLDVATLFSSEGGRFAILLAGLRQIGANIDVQVVDIETGQLVKVIPFFDGTYIAVALTAIPDMNGNGTDEIAVLGKAKGTGKAATEVKDGATGEALYAVPFP